MKEIRNCNGKLVCKANKESKTVEILQSGVITSICFMPDGSIAIKNKKIN